MQVRGRLRRGLRAAVAMTLACTTAFVAFSGPSASIAVEPDGVVAPQHNVARPQVLTSPGGPDAPRIAYTSDSDQVAGLSDPFAANGASTPRHLHVGELSNQSQGYYAFVSAEGTDPGTVYVGQHNGSSSTPAAITCDGKEHGHPTVMSANYVILPTGIIPTGMDLAVLVAYSTKVNATTYQIDVTVIDTNVLGSNPLSCTAPGVTSYTLAGQSGSDFYPTWGPTRGDVGAKVPTLIYTSTRDDPLGDLYYQPLTDASTATRLFAGVTPAGVGNTEPFFYAPQNSLLFTTTMFRRDESLGTTKVSFADTVPTTAPTTSGLNSAWTRIAIQSSQGTYTEPNPGDDTPAPVQFTTTSGGQHNELAATDTDFDSSGFHLLTTDLTLDQADSGASTGEGGQSGLNGSGIEIPGHTQDSLNGTVSDVLTTDPSTTRDLVTPSVSDPDGGSIPVDASDPTYSPDGRRIAYSKATNQYGSGVVGRQIFIADADGSNAFALVDGANDSVDVDTNPAWSPDGDHLAFTRVALARGPQGFFTVSSVRIMVASNVSAATPAAPTVSVQQLATPDGGEYWDTSPSWSPDGSAIALVRDPLADVVPSTTVPVGSTHVSSAQTVTITVDNDGVTSASGVRVTISFGSDSNSARFVPSSPYPAGCTPSPAAPATPTQLSCPVNDIDAGGSATITVNGTVTVACGQSGSATVTTIATTTTTESDFFNDIAAKKSFTVEDNGDPCVGLTGNLWHGWAPHFAAPDSVATQRVVRPFAAAPAPTTVGALMRDAIRGLADNITGVSDGSPTSTAQLWVQHLDTGDGRPLATTDCTTCAVVGRSPAWAPDGLHIAYENNGVIYDATLADADGDGLADVPETVASTSAVTGYSTYDTATPQYDPTAARSVVSQAFDPAWWPDSSAIVFTGQPLDQATQRDLYLVNTDGTGVRQLTNGRNPESEAAVQPFDDLAVTMSAAPVSIRVGDTAQVSVTVTNNGASTATGVTLSMPVPPGMQVDSDPGCTPAGPVASATTITCTVPDLPAGVSYGPLDLGVTGTAEGSSTFVGTASGALPDADHSNDSAQATIRVGPREAGLALTLTAAPSSIPIGGTSDLTATVSNNGPSDAPNTNLTLSVPSGMTITTQDASCTPPPPTSGPATITCAVGTVASGASVTLDFDTTGTTPDAYTFHASVESDATDPDTSDNTATTTVTVQPKPTRPADLAVSITLAQTAIDVGDSDTATVTVTNNGPNPALNVRLTTSFPPALNAAATPPCAAGSSPCSLGTMPSGGEISYNVSLQAGPVGHPPHSYLATITASVSSDTTDPVSSNNTDQAQLAVHQPGTPPPPVRHRADLVVTVHLDPLAYVGGRQSHASIVVRNRGVRAAHDVRLHVNAPGRLDADATPSCAAGGTCSLGTFAPGQRRTLTVTLRPQRLQPARSYTSVVSARARTTTPETTLRNNHDSDSVRVKQPRLRLLPPIGPPGFVTLAFAENLPPHVRITLTWKTGITSDVGPYRVERDGTVEAPVLVIRRDQLGERKLVLRGPAGRFGQIEAAMLVVPRTEAPPRFLGRG